MMREIKFRAWERELQMMVYDTELGGWHFEYDGNPVRAVNQMINEEDYFYDLMQYTGLKDQNDTEIYEGDIVLFDSKLYPVEFKNGNFGVKKLMKVNLYTDEMREYQEPLWNLVVDGCEVIGNIYENPEILGDSQ